MGYFKYGGIRELKYIANCSFGKDSLAQIIKIKELGLPLDEVIYCDVRFSPLISGEHPLMAEWIPCAEEILEKQFGIKVKHISAKTTFTEQFYKIKQKGKHIGEIYGFPYTIGAWCNSRLKVNPLSQYISSINDEVYQYIGIAYDEPERYQRLKQQETPKVKYGSVLYENQITEPMAFEICEKYNLVSPIYSDEVYRGGCWFCVKQCYADLYKLWKEYPDYFNMLLEMEKDSSITFKPNYTLKEFVEKFENGYIPKRRKTSKK